MEKFLLLAGLCFLFCGLSGLLAHGIGDSASAAVFIKMSWVCLAYMFVHVVVAVLLS